MVSKTMIGIALVSSVALAQAQGGGIPTLSLTEISDRDMEETTLEFAPEIVCKKTSVKGRLLYDKEGFFVRKDDEDVRVKNYDTDKFLRDRSVKDMAKFALLGKFGVTESEEGEYSIQARGELKGGGPVLALCAGISVRVVGYGTWGVCALTIPGFMGTGPAAFAVIENAATYATATGFLTPSI